MASVPAAAPADVAGDRPRGHRRRKTRIATFTSTPAPALALARGILLALAVGWLTACTSTQPTRTMSGTSTRTPTPVSAATAAPAPGSVATPGGTPRAPGTTGGDGEDAAWPPPLGPAPVDAAIDALRAGDSDALLALVRPATGSCTTAAGAGGPPKCPDGVADGTPVDYFPYFECDGWGSAESAIARLMDDSTYALAVLAYDPPVAGRVTDDAVIRHAVVLARAGFGELSPEDDSRLVTTLAVDGEAIREITGDCGGYAQPAFEAGDLPDAVGDARVLWRRYGASTPH